ncbi:MAG: nickel-responsive transcriptional regulator NikR [Gammaproteobacteria bacterium]|nr:nickel-responsive transcriptional regulator NikR [Gammaproteobacteria bacterium]
MNEKANVSRISISLPESLLKELDWMVEVRGFESRSQAIGEMIYQQLSDYKVKLGEEIMAGTINLVYDHSIPGLKKRLSDLQHEYIDEVVSSLSVNLLHAQTMEVVLVQGPADRLRLIADKMIACRGVISGRLLMSTSILPQVHPLPGAATQ